MRFSWIGGLVVLSLVSLGCGDSTDGDGSEGSSSTASTPTSAGTTETDPPETTTGTPPPQTGTADGTADGSTTTDDPPPATSTGPSESSTGEGESGGVCPPPPPAGDVCLECVHANCCTAWQACQADEPCACVVDCHVVQGNSLGMCSNSCNLDSDLYQALYFCGQGSCLGNCDWDCC